MASVYDIIKGLNQAAANAYDGSHVADYNADGEERKAGLKREEGNPITDSRVIDGFKVRISGPKCIVTYQSEIPMKDFHNTKLEDELEQTYAEIIKFLKKEYKAITKETLSLTPEGDLDILVQNMSKIRTWVQCTKVYTIGNMTDVIPTGEPSKDRVEDSFRKFLELDTDKKPKNVTRKSD
jgi:hypothetical protein